MKRSGSSNRLAKPLLLAGICLVAAPTYAELPEQAFTIARLAIEEAQEVDADAVAGAELQLAESKLQEAIEASEDNDDVDAERLLDQAVLHAEYAEVSAMLATAELSLEQLEEARVTLGAELGRD